MTSYTNCAKTLLCGVVFIIWGALVLVAPADAASQHSADFENTEPENREYLAVSHAGQTGLAIEGDITVEAWIKPEDEKAAGVIASKIATGPGEGYELSYRRAGGSSWIQWRIKRSDRTDSIRYDIDLPKTAWTHIAVYRNAETREAVLHINGQKVAASAGVLPAIGRNDAAFAIGANDAGDFFDGLIDDVRVWNVVRTEAEIEAHMMAELAGDEPGLAGYWTLNEEGGNRLDKTAHGNDLADYNTVSFSKDTPIRTRCTPVSIAERASGGRTHSPPERLETRNIGMETPCTKLEEKRP